MRSAAFDGRWQESDEPIVVGGGAPGKRTLTAQLAPRPEGRELPAPLAVRLRAAFGRDLAAVRVHTGEASARAAAEMGARAFTVGNDIHMRVQCYRDGGLADAEEVAAEDAARDAGAPDQAVAPEAPPPPEADPGATGDDAKVKQIVDDALQRAGYRAGGGYTLEQVRTVIDECYSITTRARNETSEAAQDPNLAAADHYFTTRHAVLDTQYTPAPVAAAGQVGLVLGYEAVKYVLQKLGSDVGAVGAGKPSRASGLAVSWGIKGAYDGLQDWLAATGDGQLPARTPTEPGERLPGGVAPESSRAEE